MRILNIIENDRVLIFYVEFWSFSRKFDKGNWRYTRVFATNMKIRQDGDDIKRADIQCIN